MNGRRATLVLCAVLVASIALTAAVATGQTGTTTLETEDLRALPDGFTSTASCDTAATSTVSWSATGIATGPYPGTFTLSGTLTIGPQTLPARPPSSYREGTVAGPVQSFQESFTIYSGTTTITGTKTLLQPVSSGSIATCEQVTRFPILDFFDGHGTVVEGSAATRYQASISGANGTTSDSGIAYASLAEIDITGSCPTGPTCEGRLAGFDETFALSDKLSSTTGSSNGGGQVASGTGSGKVTFAFDARSDESGMRASCNIVDHLTRRHIDCETADSYSRVGNHVSITGQAKDGGVQTRYRIEADDNAEPNGGTDTFTIETDTGYFAGGNVAKGNVQVR